MAAIEILVVEDNDPVRTLLRLTLVKEGYRVTEARNGNEALQVFNTLPVSLVITDILMPEMEGIETIQELRRIDPTVRIIAISGGGRIDPRLCLSMAKKMGADRVIAKPFAPEPLLQTIRELFD